MTKTIELKTIRTAEEPDRTRKYKGATRSTDGTTPNRSHLQYDEDRQGWTWGTKVYAGSWSEIVSQYPELFPLEEVAEPKPVHRITSGNKFREEDLWGDTVRVQSYSSNMLVEIHDGDEDSELTVSLTPAQAARLRDFLVETVKTTEA